MVPWRAEGCRGVQRVGGAPAPRVTHPSRPASRPTPHCRRRRGAGAARVSQLQGLPHLRPVGAQAGLAAPHRARFGGSGWLERAVGRQGGIASHCGIGHEDQTLPRLTPACLPRPSCAAGPPHGAAAAGRLLPGPLLSGPRRAQASHADRAAHRGRPLPGDWLRGHAAHAGAWAGRRASYGQGVGCGCAPGAQAPAIDSPPPPWWQGTALAACLALPSTSPASTCPHPRATSWALRS